LPGDTPPLEEIQMRSSLVRSVTLRVTLAMLVSLAGASCAAAGEGPAPADEAAAERRPTEVVIIGTLHGAHETNRNYNERTLRNILLALEPDAICVELYSTFFNPDGSYREEVMLDHPEGRAEVAAAEAMDIPLLPFDREGRNERYQETRYFKRLRSANEAIQRWIERMGTEEPDSLPPKVVALAYHIGGSQSQFNASGTAELVNSEAFDGVIRAKRGLADLIEMLMRPYPECQEAAKDLDFIEEEWRERNTIMADNITRIASRFPGGRIAVMTGAEHRHMLRDLLSEREGIALKEFWEIIPETTRVEQRKEEREYFGKFGPALERAWEVMGPNEQGLVDWDAVESAFREVLEIDQYYLPVRLMLGRMYTRCGRYEEALQLLPPDRFWGGLHRAFCLDALGRREEAVAAYTDLQDVQGTPAAWIERGLEQPTWLQDLHIQSEDREVRLSPTASWRASASESYKSLTPDRAIDGDPVTNWTAGGSPGGPSQAPGQWFVLDFGAPLSITRAVFDHQGTKTIYVSAWPRGVRASITRDGKTWELVEVIPPGPLQPLTIRFSGPNLVRAIRLELTAEHQPEWWGIHEVHVFGPASAAGDE
jgi:tetratricopeptide (TPR) repeat protein